MKLNFTKKEYRTLVEMLLIADWILRAHEVAPREETKPFSELRKKILAHHKEMGMAEEFKYEPQHDDYFETKAYEDRAPHMQAVDAYDEQTFWEMLADKLARRDLAAEEALQADGFADGEDRMNRFFEISGRYEDEFAEHGLDNIRLVKHTNPAH